MSAFSATDAAFEGFRLTRERPRTVLVWAVLCFLVSVCSAIYLTTVGREASAMLDAGPADTPNLAALGEMLAVLFPMMIVGLLFQCVMAAAVYRVTLRPEDRGFAYLKLGADEARLAALTGVYFMLVLLATIGAVLVAGLIAALVMAVAGQGAGAMMGIVIEFFILGVLFYTAVRLSLAPAITFSEHRLAIFDSWRLTKGQFWKLTGAYGLAICGIIAMSLLVLVIFAAAVAIAKGGNLQEAGKMFSPDSTSVQSYFTLTTVLYLLVSGWLTAIYYAVVIAPAAVAYRGLTKAADA
ncbi:MAG: hypothetical protein C0481_03415 [Phenylobacterium sp.]|uniref:hypothetical protein n=1 Tax=Phenylobacterium sp. TaxID=1871053 RepID=UPI002600E960|nr:hypothetical protein [Phenylobacterium sp.]MBA4010893.1 hypothetical protein [Phenylobacterium sp.]